MKCEWIDQYLSEHNVPHRLIKHTPAFTAQEIAASSHVKGRDFAKTVIVRTDNGYAMTVVPADEKIVPTRLREILGVKDLSIAPESEFTERFPDCEPGAMPPLGRHFGMPVLVSETLARQHNIAFNAGSHTECVEMSYEDFARLEHPTVGNFTSHA